MKERVLIPALFALLIAACGAGDTPGSTEPASDKTAPKDRPAAAADVAETGSVWIVVDGMVKVEGIT
jgi:hypothetical protein